MTNDYTTRFFCVGTLPKLILSFCSWSKVNSEIYSLSLATCILLSAGQTTADPNDEDDVVASEALNSVWSGFSSEVMRIPDFAANTRLMIMSFGRFGIFMQMFSGNLPDLSYWDD